MSSRSCDERHGGPTVDDPHPRDHAELLRLPYFHNLAVYRWIAAKDVVESGKELMRRLQQVIDRIERALA